MPYGAIVAGLTIQAGAMIIQEGMKRIIPEIAKLCYDPSIADLAKDLNIEEKLTKTLIAATKSKS